MNTFQLPDRTHIENIHLNVHSIKQTLPFYNELLGFKEIRREASTVFLSASGNEPAQILLTERPDAKPRSRRSPGLFHVAILFPNRKELARVFKQLNEHNYPFQGAADHGVSEALYLAEPEGNGIELYADRPRKQWQYRNGELAMMTAELDLQSLAQELSGEDGRWNGVHPETRIGHVHLQVSDLSNAEQFYHHLLGFDVVTRSYPGALFVSAGGYHHHLGLNIWNSRGSAPAAPDTLGLHSFRIGLPEQNAVEALQQRVGEAGFSVENDDGAVLVSDTDGILVELFAQKEVVT